MMRLSRHRRRWLRLAIGVRPMARPPVRPATSGLQRRAAIYIGDDVGASSSDAQLGVGLDSFATPPAIGASSLRLVAGPIRHLVHRRSLRRKSRPLGHPPPAAADSIRSDLRLSMPTRVASCVDQLLAGLCFRRVRFESSSRSGDSPILPAWLHRITSGCDRRAPSRCRLRKSLIVATSDGSARDHDVPLADSAISQLFEPIGRAQNRSRPVAHRRARSCGVGHVGRAQPAHRRLSLILLAFRFATHRLPNRLIRSDRIMPSHRWLESSETGH